MSDKLLVNGASGVLTDDHMLHTSYLYFNMCAVLQTLWCYVSVFENYTYFTLPCRGLGLVRLSLYLVHWPTIVLQCF